MYSSSKYHTTIACDDDSMNIFAAAKIGKNIYKFDVQVKFLLSLAIISDVYISFIPNKTAFTKSVLLSGFQISLGDLKSTE